jgi:hypothetical protein
MTLPGNTHGQIAICAHDLLGEVPEPGFCHARLGFECDLELTIRLGGRVCKLRLGS